jgi:Mg-chelatase subunit ChlD
MTDRTPQTPPLPNSLTKTTSNTTLNKPDAAGKIRLPGLHARLTSPKISAELDPATKPNRIALMLDASGSMSGDKIDALRTACGSFVSACNFSDTALAVETFGAEPEIRVALTCQQPLLAMTVMTIPACGGTPMANAMDYVLNSYSITRGVIVSDGQPDSEQAAYGVAEHYKAAEIPIDCVHIGADAGGEACLRRIAEMTSGKFIKFTDIASFAKSFKYLTPAFYAQLSDGSMSAALLGAKEVK